MTARKKVPLYQADKIVDPRGRVLEKPWGVFRSMLGGMGRSLESKHSTEAEARAEAARQNEH